MELSFGRNGKFAPNRTFKALLLGVCCVASPLAPASAAVIVNNTVVDFTGGAFSLGFGTSDITFSDISGGGFSFEPVGVSTKGGGAVGYLSFFGVPSTYFDPIRGSGSLTFDASTEFAGLPSTTTIPYSITPFIIALADTTADGVHYGYGRFSGTTLLSYGFESVAGQAITVTNLSPVPLPASAPLFGAALLALGAVGYGVQRRKASATA